jgi:hypothetical protein
MTAAVFIDAERPEGFLFYKELVGEFKPSGRFLVINKDGFAYKQ